MFQFCLPVCSPPFPAAGELHHDFLLSCPKKIHKYSRVPGFEPSTARIFSTLSCSESGSCINLRLDAEALNKASALTANGYRVSSGGDGTVLELDRADVAQHSVYTKTSTELCALKQ